MPGKEKGAVSHNSGLWRKFLHRGDPDGSQWSPGMVDIVLRGKGGHYWFWKPGAEHTIHTVPELMRMYCTSVGRNANLLIGVVVNNQGLVPEPDVKRLAEFGAELGRCFGKAIAETHGQGSKLVLTLPALQKVDHVVIMEDIVHGERIREYKIEGLLADGSWKELCKGTAVGHKRIQKFAEQEISQLKLIVTESRAEPKIRKLAAYYVAKENQERIISTE